MLVSAKVLAAIGLPIAAVPTPVDHLLPRNVAGECVHAQPLLNGVCRILKLRAGRGRIGFQMANIGLVS